MPRFRVLEEAKRYVRERMSIIEAGVRAEQIELMSKHPYWPSGCDEWTRRLRAAKAYDAPFGRSQLFPTAQDIHA